MFTSPTKLEVLAAHDRRHSYYCDPGSPYFEMYEALGTMRSFILKQMNEQQQKENDAEEKLKEECCKPNEECCKESGEE